MAIPTYNINTTGQFVPTTYVFDVTELQELDVNSEQFKELLVRLYQNLNRMQLALNEKTTGTFALNQFVTGQLYYPGVAPSALVKQTYRPVTRLTIEFGALPSTATKSVAHGINFNSGVTFTRIYGTTTDPVAFVALPLPYASPTDADNIALNVDATNVNVITGSNRTAFTRTNIVLEFLTEN